jgi:cob(I)alamin adenosyltransferase
MKLYTKTGDDGTTGLFGGRRVSKASARVEAYGTVDETNAVIGLARASSPDPWTDAVLAQLQNDLFVVGAELASIPEKQHHLSVSLLGDADIERLEKTIDEADAACPPLKVFVLPGGSSVAAALHLARTVSRRAERAVLRLDDAPARPQLLVYLNRLSDLLFALARRANAVAAVPDVPWAHRS